MKTCALPIWDQPSDDGEGRHPLGDGGVRHRRRGLPIALDNGLVQLLQIGLTQQAIYSTIQTLRARAGVDPGFSPVYELIASSALRITGSRCASTSSPFSTPKP